MVPPPAASTTSASRMKRDRILMANSSTTGAASRSTHTTFSMMTTSTTAGSGGPGTSSAEEDHPDLLELEERLNHDVDEDFFVDPRKFHTLHRVIDVLGMQLDSGGGGADRYASDTTREQRGDLASNPAYQDLKRQQQVVEEAIEHLALIHCADLNGSVVQVGRVARQFHDAATQVRHLRKQVKEIQETLGATGHVTITNTTTSTAGTGTGGTTNAPTTTTTTTTTTVAAQSAMSLRELWLKKLEAEAVLSLLDKLDRIRAAPRQFDLLVEQHRIGAAVITIANALDTMFSSDVAQVQALHKIMEQLMMRKQKAEEIVWELLLDVVFLRNGNHPHLYSMMRGSTTTTTTTTTTSTTAGGTGGAGGTGLATTVTTTTAANAMGAGKDTVAVGTSSATTTTTTLYANPFLTPTLRFALEQDLQVDPQQQHHHYMNAAAAEDAAAVGAEDWQQDDDVCRDNMMIPPSVMDAEFDLESEERRHLEELKDHHQQQQQQLSSTTTTSGPGSSEESKDDKKDTKPQYSDHILALRTLVECLIRLRRIDDVERMILENANKEVEALVQREQARTFLRVESVAARSRYAMLQKSDLRDFRKHLESVVSAFGNVQLRLAHLAQIVRHRLATEKLSHSAAYSTPSAALATAIKSAKQLMERELKSFLDACLQESPENKEPEFNINALTNVSGQSRQIAAKTKAKRKEMGLFSLGIIETSNKDSAASTAEAWLTASTTSRRTTIQSLATPKFVAEVLFAKTTHNGTPQVRHALLFRKALAKWHQDFTTLRNQLAQATMEDTSAPTYRNLEEQPALEHLDVVIQKDLLPILQEEAVNGTVQALERPDAFDPVLDRNVYKRSDSNEPQDVDMCRACTALYNYTGPLFMALHRLPKGGDMYLPLVAVLEHVILTFISRVKQQVSRLCQNKSALQLIMDSTDGASFAVSMERRKAYAQLVLAYADGDLLEAAAVSDETEATAVPLLSPSGNDSPSKAQIQQSKMAALSGLEDLDFVGGVEREELNLSKELQFVKPFLEFAGMEHNNTIKTCTDETLMKSACLAHSLLKLASLLDSRLKVRSALGSMAATKTLTNTRALREAIKTLKANGLKMAKFCRADVLLQAITRLSKVCNSSTVVARDAVRIPSSVNDLGEYMTAASDNLREAAGNAVTAYAFSSLEQYIPLCLIQNVRVLAAGKGIVAKAPLTMNGIEALDRSGSVLYRDLKGATSFDNSFWDIELAAVSFERSASFIAMMELEMAELEAYYQENRNDFSEQDFQLMFAMNGPRRKGDIGRYHMLVKRLDKK